MARKRRRFTPEFKARVALEALQERDSVQAIAARHELHPNQVSAWKRQLLDAVSEAFAKGGRRKLAKSLLLWGGVDAGGTPYLEPAFFVNAPVALPDPADEYRIAGQTSNGHELFSLRFAMPGVADGDGRASG